MYDSVVEQQQQQQQQSVRKRINGIDVEELVGTIEAVREQPELAALQFRVSDKWISGTHNRSTVNELYGAGQEHSRENPFVIDKDEPPFLMGTNIAANPVEYALAALAGCLTTTLVLFATVEGIELKEVTSRFEGDASLLGFLGLDENKRMGCEEIRVTFDIKSDAPREKIEALLELAQARSGVFDMLTNRTPVSVKLAG